MNQFGNRRGGFALRALTARVTARYRTPMAEYCARLQRQGLRPRYILEVKRTLLRADGETGGLAAANRDSLEGWWDSLQVGPGARNAYHAHLAGYFKYLRQSGVRSDDPMAALIKPRMPRQLPRPIDDVRLAKALGAAVYPINAWLLLASMMGLRAHEIAGLHGEDISPDHVLIRDGKGGKQRVVPLHPDVAAVLRAPRPGLVFLNTQGRPLTANTLSHRANRFLHDLGISDTLHTLRHWYGTNVYRESQDLRLTQELLGHSSPTTTALYVAWNDSAAMDVVHRLSVDGRSYHNPRNRHP